VRPAPLVVLVVVLVLLLNLRRSGTRITPRTKTRTEQSGLQERERENAERAAFSIDGVQPRASRRVLVFFFVLLPLPLVGLVVGLVLVPIQNRREADPAMLSFWRNETPTLESA
jgi:hypothetical protein